MNPTHEDVAWCRNLFNLIAEGGIWGVPRTGLVFRKQEGTLILVERMPHETAMPLTAAGLRGLQDADYFAIRTHFRLAGIAVKDET